MYVYVIYLPDWFVDIPTLSLVWLILAIPCYGLGLNAQFVTLFQSAGLSSQWNRHQGSGAPVRVCLLMETIK